MKFDFRFSNLLGTVYTKGNLEFTSEGDSVLSPVGNRVSKFDLKNNKAETFPVETKFNITTVALSPDGWLLLLVDEHGECLLCNTKSKSVVHRFNFARKIHAIKFSPDGKKFAVCKENKVLLYNTPGRNKQFNPFQLIRTFYGAYDETVCLDWTSDSQALVAGSRDMSSRVHAAGFYENLTCYVLGGHSESLVGCFFLKDSLNLYTISRNGRLNAWECDTKLDGLIKSEKPGRDEETDANGLGQDADELTASFAAATRMDVDDDDDGKQKENIDDDEDVKFTIKYKKIAKHSIRDVLEANTPVGLLSCDYHKQNRILVTSFSNGAFLLHEMPSFNLIHSLSISQQPITSCLFNKTGDWLALACEGLGQLLVWEWQSQTYVLKQQGHFNNMSRLAYSPSGLYLASGGQDGKVKVWNTLNGQCFVTFNDHNAPITGVVFKSNGQVICSSSLDGTVRAYDLNRYRNFRTFTTPQPVQFSCLSMDASGELVAAGGFDVFDVYVWSMQTGHILQTLSGHEGPVSGVCFSPSLTRAVLASCSWDRTLRTWDVFDAKGGRESYTLSSDVLAVAFRPDAKHIACATLDAQIVIIDVGEVDQLAVIKTIECKFDLGYSRKDTDKVTAKKLQFGKAFQSLSYTMDGEYLLAGGKSKYICIYNIKEEMMVKRFEISQNKSFDGIDEFLDRRKMTEFGNMDLVEDTPEVEIDDRKIALPGVQRGDFSSRAFKPEIQVTCVSFAPTARAWSACTTEGLLIYSLDASSGLFDPFDFDIDITPRSILTALNDADYSTALMQSLRLNETALIARCIERVPVASIDVLVNSMPDVYVDKLLAFVATQLDKSAHVEFYLMWVREIAFAHGTRIKLRSHEKHAVLCLLEKAMTKKFDDLNKICDSNKYTIDYVLSLNAIRNKRLKEAAKKNGQKDKAGSSSEEEDDDEEYIKISKSSINFE